ncbi:MAG TPA: hypothetical protein VEZ40_08085 [Pyrinomonadaceae bacterium]|nr:hypothetical protein [Pyrinomonadaceae bacterium]
MQQSLKYIKNKDPTADTNRRKMRINRDLVKGDTSGIEQHETS